MSPRYNIITQNPGKKISAVNQELLDLTDNLKAALDSDPTNASISEGSGYLDLAKELKQIKDSITDLVKKTDIHESKLPTSLEPVSYSPPLAPEDYTLVTGVEINKGQLPLRDFNNNQVDGFGLAYQSGLSNDWSVEFVNATLSNGLVSNIDNILVFDGSNNDKNNLYATKKVSNVSGYAFNADVNSLSTNNNNVPIALAVSLPDNAGNKENLDINLTQKEGLTSIILLQESTSNIVNVYTKEEGDDWYKNINNVETIETEFTPSITNSSTTVSNIGLNTFFDGWDPIVYYSDTQWRLTDSGVTSWKYIMPNEYAAAGSPPAGHVADMVFYKNSPFMFGSNRRTVGGFFGLDIEPSVVPANFNLSLSDTNYDVELDKLVEPPVIGELRSPPTPTATYGIKGADEFSMCFYRYGNDNNIKNILKSTGGYSFDIDMTTNGRVPSLGTVLYRHPVGDTWDVKFTIQMKEANVGGAAGWQEESADLYDNRFESVMGSEAPYFPDTGFWYGVLTDPNNKNSKNFNSGNMINMMFGGLQNDFMKNAPGNPSRLDESLSLEAATIPTLETRFEEFTIRVECKPSNDPDYPSAIRSSMLQDNKWKIIDRTSQSYVDTEGFATSYSGEGYLGFQLESSSFTITDFEVLDPTSTLPSEI